MRFAQPVFALKHLSVDVLYDQSPLKMIIKTSLQHEEKRREAFREYTQRKINGEVITPPLHLNKEERRHYVRATLREDHTYRIKSAPEVTEEKFKKLAGSYFSFFRGTSLLYYRDYAGIDHKLPMVFTVGDVHPANFGVMPDESQVPIFGVNDFDEAYRAPFSWDLRRGSTGFWLAAREQGHSKKHRKKIVRTFIEAYLDGLREFARDDREKFFKYRIDNSPKLIRKLLENSLKSRQDFLVDKVNLEKKQFKVTREIVPHTRQVPEFQKSVNKYLQDNEIQISHQNDEFFKVVDVAVKKGSGTASLGLDRFWLLIEGRSEKPDDCIILEMKQARRSSITGLVPENNNADQKAGMARNIVEAHSVHLVGGDAFYGHVSYKDKEYIIRERSPFKDDIDLDDLSTSDFKEYARICGKCLAQTHARSDEDSGSAGKNAEEAILGSVIPEVFVEDLVRFAKSSARRVRKDHKLFKKDFKLGAFSISGN